MLKIKAKKAFEKIFSGT